MACIYRSRCSKCKKETNWVHDDMGNYRKHPDRCMECPPKPPPPKSQPDFRMLLHNLVEAMGAPGVVAMGPLGKVIDAYRDAVEALKEDK